ncbi:MAG: TonB family protein [Rhizomicrobium sp.]|nr:TonB family protein [Rhizomicrobium sp.]
MLRWKYGIVTAGLIAAAFLIAAQAASAPGAKPTSVPPRLRDFRECINHYPDTEYMDPNGGTTKLSISITKSGAVEDIRVEKSSGWAGLDHDAISCVAQWRYFPALDSGEPVATRWPVDINWQIGDEATRRRRNHDASAVASPDADICFSRYPKSAHDAGIEGSVVIAFQIDTLGRVLNPTVAVSSGNADLDAASVECSKLQAYDPAVKDGFVQPFKASRKVVWKLADKLYPKVTSRVSCWTFLLQSGAKLSARETSADLSLIVEDGQPRDIKIKTSSGNSAIDDAAIRCVSEWRFEKILRDGKPVAMPDSLSVKWVNPERMGSD